MVRFDTCSSSAIAVRATRQRQRAQVKALAFAGAFSFGRTGSTNLPVVASPGLAIQTFTNNSYLVWTAGAPLLKLETATNLDFPVWTEIAGPPQVGDQYVMPFTMDEPVRFYRLRYGN